MNVTSAFEPSPPLRHDCEEILRPSTGGFAGAVVSGTEISGGAAVVAAGLLSVGPAGGSGLARVALVAVTGSFDPELSCTTRKTTVDAAPDWLSASLGQGSNIQAVHP